MRHGGTHGELLSALAKASPRTGGDGLAGARLPAGHRRRARAHQVAEARQTTFNRFRVVAVIPGSSFNPVQAVLQTLVVISFIRLLDSGFQLGTASPSSKPARTGDSYASPLTRRLRHTQGCRRLHGGLPLPGGGRGCLPDRAVFLAATPVAGAVFAPTDRQDLARRGDQARRCRGVRPRPLRLARPAAGTASPAWPTPAASPTSDCCRAGATTWRCLPSRSACRSPWRRSRSSPSPARARPGRLGHDGGGPLPPWHSPCCCAPAATTTSGPTTLPSWQRSSSVDGCGGRGASRP